MAEREDPEIPLNAPKAGTQRRLHSNPKQQQQI